MEPLSRTRGTQPAGPISDPGVEPEAFKAAFRQHPAGVAVITAEDGTGPVAMTATSVISVSAVPPLIVFSASAMSSATVTLLRVEHVVIHLVGADELALAVTAATSGVDRFANAPWYRLAGGEPVYADASLWMRARIVNRIDAGSATVFLAEVVELQSAAVDIEERSPLVYQNRSWHWLGRHSRLERS